MSGGWWFLLGVLVAGPVCLALGAVVASWRDDPPCASVEGERQARRAAEVEVARLRRQVAALQAEALVTEEFLALVVQR